MRNTCKLCRKWHYTSVAFANHECFQFRVGTPDHKAEVEAGYDWETIWATDAKEAGEKWVEKYDYEGMDYMYAMGDFDKVYVTGPDDVEHVYAVEAEQVIHYNLKEVKDE